MADQACWPTCWASTRSGSRERAARAARLLKNGLAVIPAGTGRRRPEIARLAGGRLTLIPGSPSRGRPPNDAAARSLERHSAEVSSARGFAGGSETDYAPVKLAAELRQVAAGMPGRHSSGLRRTRSTRRQGRAALAPAGRYPGKAPACRTGPSLRCTPAVLRWSRSGRVGIAQADGGGGGAVAYRPGDGRQALADKDGPTAAAEALTQQIEGIERRPGSCDWGTRTCSGASDFPRKCPASGPTCRGRCKLLGDAMDAPGHAAIPSWPDRRAA